MFDRSFTQYSIPSQRGDFAGLRDPVKMVLVNNRLRKLNTTRVELSVTRVV
jgi:hypothetical protein